VRVFKTKWFVRFARKEGIADSELCEAVARAERGLIDADLGGGVIKQRLARPGQGKSGGFRSIVLFQIRHRAVFAYGFAKSERDNIDGDELRAFRDLAAALLAYDDEQLRFALDSNVLKEVTCHGQQDVP
jgi:hypothetical protein